jgi:hypothetical protein
MKNGNSSLPARPIYNSSSVNHRVAAMNPKTPEPERPAAPSEADDAASKTTPGTEARRKGSVEAAKRQAERDWEDSAKESGD